MNENNKAGINRHPKLIKVFFLAFYYGFARYLPASQIILVGKLSKAIRYFCCKHIFASIGKYVNVERGAYFGTGFQLQIGNYSGLGKHCRVPANLVVGNYVMMGRNVVIYNINHRFEDSTLPMMFQGITAKQKTVIGDDVWIGERVMVMAGKNIESHAIIGAGAVVSKDVPAWAIAGGNPIKVIKYRDQNDAGVRIPAILYTFDKVDRSV
jgi:maltose O-acetyltransferase